MAFETIVAGAEHAALPHARPRNRPFAPGLPVVVDLGCVVDGYCSDITRCLAVGPLAVRWEEIRETVSTARAAAIAAIRPGVRAGDVDSVAREVLAVAGLADAFVHSLGHGVGLEVHEAPRIAAGSADVLAEGMVVTVEPGVYLAGEGGLRLEDMVLVTADGAERLNRLDDGVLGAG
jgi:Xaa-Pro aminopeptidase